MNFLNLKIETLTGEAFLGAEPVDRATWICLMRYCAQQETGGTIQDCATWGDRKWMQLCGVTKGEVGRDTELWSWDGADLRVAFYPAEQEEVVRAKREAGKRYGAGHPKDSKSTPDKDSKSTPQSSAGDKGKERKGKGNEKEGKDKTPSPPPQARVRDGGKTPTASAAWAIGDYVEPTRELVPEYALLDADVIVNAMQGQSDPELRAKAWNEFAMDVLGSIEVPLRPGKMLRRYVQYADYSPPMKISGGRNGKKLTTGDLVAAKAKELEDARRKRKAQ